MKNLSIPLDRTRRVILGTGMERLEQVPGRILVAFTRTYGQNQAE